MTDPTLADLAAPKERAALLRPVGFCVLSGPHLSRGDSELQVKADADETRHFHYR